MVNWEKKIIYVEEENDSELVEIVAEEMNVYVSEKIKKEKRVKKKA
ncbi:MAG: hypothetical protein ACLKAK_07075 [Alkaliphilus sp.]